MSANKEKLAAVFTVLLVIAVFFVSDALRVRNYGLPPIFCIPSETLADGKSRIYYGIGYKILEDTEPFSSKTEYHITLWILPAFISV